MCAQVPHGRHIVGVYGEGGALVSDTDRAQTVVADGTRVIAFGVIDEESPAPQVKSMLKIKHNGKLQELELDVPGCRKGKK